MKKLLLAVLLLAMGSIAMADSAQSILKKAREDYYKEQKGEKVREVSADDVYVTEEAEEEVVPATPLEKLEYNVNKANIKVDFYERVVRSVAREEKELAGYNEVLGKNKPKKAAKTKIKKK